jgi:hypothetical protein
MKRFIKNIFLFVVLFFFIEKMAWLLLVNGVEKQFDKRLKNIITGQINKELIILGSSRGIGNIIAGKLQQETSLTTHNLSYHGSNVIFHEYILKLFLKYNKTPKVIILTIDNPSEFLEDKSITFREDMLKPFTRYNCINNTLIERGVHSSLSSLLFTARLHGSHFFTNKKEPHKNNPMDSLGTMPLLEKTSLYLFYDKQVKPYKIIEEQDAKLKAFENIQHLCKTNNIILVYAIPPSFNTFNYNFYKRFKTLVEEKHIMVYDTLKSEYKDTAYYFDESHLLKKGAEIFTTEISTFINQNTDINPQE